MHADFLVLFNIACGMSQVHTLGRQVSPGNSTYFTSAFEDATEPMYGYLLVDNRDVTSKQYRLWTNILPNEFQNVYEALEGQPKGRRKRKCPICGKQDLVKLSNHLADVHHLTREERLQYLKCTKTAAI